MSLIKVRGAVVVEVTDKSGKVTFRRRTENLVVNTGDILVADRLSLSPTFARLTCMGLGTNSASATKGQTELSGEIAATRPGFSGDYTPSRVGDTITFRSLWGPGHASSTLIWETGIFNLGAVGDMFARAVFTQVVSKGTNDTLQVTWTMTMSGA